MREVTEFVVMLPVPAEEGDLMQAEARLAREFPHYSFEFMTDPQMEPGERMVLPVMGTVGGTWTDDVFMCKPLDPRVIPEIEAVLAGPEQVH